MIRSAPAAPLMAATRSACRPAQLMRSRQTTSPCVGVNDLLRSFRLDPVTRRPVRIAPPRGADLAGIPLRHAAEIDDAGRRSPERADPGRVRLDLPHPVRTDLLDPFDAVGERALADLDQARQLRGLERHDELAAPLVRDAVLRRELLQRGPPFAAEPRLSRAGRVVEARVNDAAVVPGLVRRQLALLLDDGERQAGLAQEELVGGGEPDDAAADDRPGRTARSLDFVRVREGRPGMADGQNRDRDVERLS